MTSLLIAEPPLQVLPTLATLIGLNDSIFLQQLHWRLLSSTREREGRKWVFYSYGEWRKNDFPFWSEKTIQRVAGRLDARGLIIIRNDWNRMPIDNTNWYSIDYDELESLTSGQSVQMVRTKCPDGQDNLSTPSGQLVLMDWTKSPDVSGQSVQTNNIENQNPKERNGIENPTNTIETDDGAGESVFSDSMLDLEQRRVEAALIYVGLNPDECRKVAADDWITVERVLGWGEYVINQGDNLRNPPGLIRSKLTERAEPPEYDNLPAVEARFEEWLAAGAQVNY